MWERNAELCLWESSDCTQSSLRCLNTDCGSWKKRLHHASAALLLEFNLFHGKISVVVVARAKFWLSYLRTKLCNSPSFPAPSPCVSPHVPLSQVFFSSLSGFGKCVCLPLTTGSARSRFACFFLLICFTFVEFYES